MFFTLHSASQIIALKLPITAAKAFPRFGGMREGGGWSWVWRELARVEEEVERTKKLPFFSHLIKFHFCALLLNHWQIISSLLRRQRNKKRRTMLPWAASPFPSLCAFFLFIRDGREGREERGRPSVCSFVLCSRSASRFVIYHVASRCEILSQIFSLRSAVPRDKKRIESTSTAQLEERKTNGNVLMCFFLTRTRKGGKERNSSRDESLLIFRGARAMMNATMLSFQSLFSPHPRHVSLKRFRVWSKYCFAIKQKEKSIKINFYDSSCNFFAFFFFMSSSRSFTPTGVDEGGRGAESILIFYLSLCVRLSRIFTQFNSCFLASSSGTRHVLPWIVFYGLA